VLAFLAGLTPAALGYGNSMRWHDVHSMHMICTVQSCTKANHVFFGPYSYLNDMVVKNDEMILAGCWATVLFVSNAAGCLETKNLFFGGAAMTGSAVGMLAGSMLAKVFNVGIVTHTIGSDAGQ
jgi:hypothetical protein